MRSMLKPEERRCSRRCNSWSDSQQHNTAVKQSSKQAINQSLSPLTTHNLITSQLTSLAPCVVLCCVDDMAVCQAVEAHETEWKCSRYQRLLDAASGDIVSNASHRTLPHNTSHSSTAQPTMTPASAHVSLALTLSCPFPPLSIPLAR